MRFYIKYIWTYCITVDLMVHGAHTFIPSLILLLNQFLYTESHNICLYHHVFKKNISYAKKKEVYRNYVFQIK